MQPTRLWPKPKPTPPSYWKNGRCPCVASSKVSALHNSALICPAARTLFALHWKEFAQYTPFKPLEVYVVQTCFFSRPYWSEKFHWHLLEKLNVNKYVRENTLDSHLVATWKGLLTFCLACPAAVVRKMSILIRFVLEMSALKSLSRDGCSYFRFLRNREQQITRDCLW